MRSFHKSRQLILCAAAAGFAAVAPAFGAITFNISYDSSLNGYPQMAQLQSAVNFVAGEFSADFTTP